jgi:hypothetical protein
MVMAVKEVILADWEREVKPQGGRRKEVIVGLDRAIRHINQPCRLFLQQVDCPRLSGAISRWRDFLTVRPLVKT